MSPDIRQNDATANPIGLADPFRNTVAEVDRYLPVQDLMLLEQRMERSRWAYPLFGTVFSVFAAIALILSAAGVFALVADSVRRRIPEFGIRLALGATPRQVRSLVLSYALRRVGLGVALGLPLAYGASQILGSMLIGVDPSDAVTVGAVSCFLLAARPASYAHPPHHGSAARIDRPSKVDTKWHSKTPRMLTQARYGMN